LDGCLLPENQLIGPFLHILKINGKVKNVALFGAWSNEESEAITDGFFFSSFGSVFVEMGDLDGLFFDGCAMAEVP